jgi:hypothetical protein
VPIREVRLTARFVARAKEQFPPDGAGDGRPSYAIFEATVLPVALRAFGHNFESLTAGQDAVAAVRYLVTVCPPFVGSVLFVGSLVGNWVDPRYWDTIGIDPGQDD